MLARVSVCVERLSTDTSLGACCIHFICVHTWELSGVFPVAVPHTIGDAFECFCVYRWFAFIHATAAARISGSLFGPTQIESLAIKTTIRHVRHGHIDISWNKLKHACIIIRWEDGDWRFGRRNKKHNCLALTANSDGNRAFLFVYSVVCVRRCEKGSKKHKTTSHYIHSYMLSPPKNRICRICRTRVFCTLSPAKTPT